MTSPETERNCPQGHHLELKDYEKQYMCDGCREQGHGPRYRCEQCNYDLHKSCMVTRNNARHPFYKEETFVFWKEVPEDRGRRRCDACSQKICGFTYHSSGKDLHPCCLNLEPELSFEGIKFHLQGKVKSKCMWCKRKNLKGSIPGVRGWSYESECRNHQIHVYCVLESVLDVLKYQRQWEREGLLQLRRGNKANNSRRSIMVGIWRFVASILLGDPTLSVLVLKWWCNESSKVNGLVSNK